MEFVTKEITFTTSKGYVQAFIDHEGCHYMEKYNEENIFLFLDYLRKKKKIQFKKSDMKKIYKSFLEN